MNHREKQACIAEVQQAFSESSAAFVVGIKGLSVAQLHDFRRGIRDCSASLRVVKNTLGMRAIAGLDGMQDLRPYLKNQVALIFAHKDPAAVAKLLCDRSRQLEKLSIVAGCVDSRVFDADMVRYLGSLPPYEVVVAQACGALKAPITRHVAVLQQVMTKFVWVLKQIKSEGDAE